MNFRRAAQAIAQRASKLTKLRFGRAAPLALAGMMSLTRLTGCLDSRTSILTSSADNPHACMDSNGYGVFDDPANNARVRVYESQVMELANRTNYLDNRYADPSFQIQGEVYGASVSAYIYDDAVTFNYGGFDNNGRDVTPTQAASYLQTIAAWEEQKAIQQLLAPNGYCNNWHYTESDTPVSPGQSNFPPNGAAYRNQYTP